MQPIVYYVATSLDGVIAPTSGTFEDYSLDPELVADYLGRLGGFGSVVMGRKTYDHGLALGVTDPYPALRTYVVSRTLERSPDPKVTVVREDPVAFLRALREEDGAGIYLSGGGALAARVVEAGLLDELAVKVSPVLLGGGVRLVDALAAPARLRLLDTKRYADGALLLRYAAS